MISWPYLHTVVNHIPIVLTVVGALSVFLGLVHARRGIWLYGLTSLILAGVMVYPAWLTGNKAGDFVRDAWYIQRGAIHAHSAAAGVTMWVILGTGLIALIAWITVVRSREALSPARWLRMVMGVVALVALAAVSYTAYLGGKVVIESPILMNPTPPLAQPPGTALPVQPPPATITPSTTPAPVTGMPVPAPIQPPPSTPPANPPATP